MEKVNIYLPVSSNYSKKKLNQAKESLLIRFGSIKLSKYDFRYDDGFSNKGIKVEKNLKIVKLNTLADFVKKANKRSELVSSKAFFISINSIGLKFVESLLFLKEEGLIPKIDKRRYMMLTGSWKIKVMMNNRKERANPSYIYSEKEEMIETNKIMGRWIYP